MIFRRLAFCFAWMVSLVGVPGGAVADPISTLYQQHCAACHGENGDGQSRARYGLNPPPRDFTAARAWDELTTERLRSSILYGRPGTAMVAWEKRLTVDQIDGLVGFIQQHFMRPPTASSAGVRLYKKHCSACHGDKGNGAQWTRNSLNPAPRDFTTVVAREELDRERMMTSVTQGRPGTAMMSFSQRLSNEQIATVVDYIRKQFMHAGGAVADASVAGQTVPEGHAGGVPRRTLIALPPADMTLAFPHGLVGNVDNGRQFYLNNCFTCHGQQGQGDGPRSAFIKPRPRNFVASDAQRTLNRPALFRAIARGKQGTVMPAWDTVLDKQQIADVAEFVFQAFIQQQAIPVVDGNKRLKKKALN